MAKIVFPFIPKHDSLKAHEWPYEPNSIVDENDIPILVDSLIHFEDSKKLIDKNLAILNGYINYLRKAKKETN